MAEYFDVLNSVINKKQISDEDLKKHFVSYPTIVWLSKNPMACYASNQLNSCRGNKFIPKKADYLFLKGSIQLPKNTRLAFDKNDKEMKIIETAIKNYYKTGKSTAREYMKMMGGVRIITLLEKLAQLNNTFTRDKDILDLRNALLKKRNELLKIKGIK